MEKMNDLHDLLNHEIQDLYSAEEQILGALPAMIEKARNPQLKKALQEHLKITEKQRARLEQIQGMMNGEKGEESAEKKGLLSRLFQRSHKCLGMEGLIEEGEKVMGEDMSPEVLDAAIIACAQKIEHYEICGYGTARTYARELNLDKVAELLEQTLDEEYDADDQLTYLAVSRLNEEAKAGGDGRISGAAEGRSTNRDKAGQRVRQEEPEMELVSDANRSSSSGNGRKTSGGGNAPKGSASSRSSESNRTANSGKRTAASKSSTKSAKKSSSGRGQSSGRSSSRTNSRGR